MDGLITALAQGQTGVALLAVDNGRLWVLSRAVGTWHCLLVPGQQALQGTVGRERAGQGSLHRLVAGLVAAVRAAEHAGVLGRGGGEQLIYS